MMIETDVLIVGGSLVGLSAALFLRLHRVDCLSVERHTGTRSPTSYGAAA